MEDRLLARLEQATARKSFAVEDVDWETSLADIGGSVLPVESLSIAGTHLASQLSESETSVLARHEVASTFSAFIRFEGVLGQALTRLIRREHPSSPRLPYLLHIVEEEARHSRMFARLVAQMDAGGYPPRGAIGFVERIAEPAIANSRLVFAYSMLAVEAITDTVLERFLAVGPKFPALVDVSRIHRVEEARHIAFARAHLRDEWQRAGLLRRVVLRFVSPWIAAAIYEALVPAAVYRRSGVANGLLASWRVWRASHRSAERQSLRESALGRIRGELGAVDERCCHGKAWRMIGLPER